LSQAEPASATAASAHTGNPSLGELTQASLKIGCLSFGGPAAQIAMMHRVFVDEKKWIDEPRYLYALNYCMLLPGPEAQQLATYVGWLLHGVKGGLIAGALFVLPGALVVLGLSWLYLTHGSAPLVGAAFFGVRAAVVAFVIEALIRISKRALKTRADYWVAIACFAALTLFAAPFPLIIISAALTGAFVLKRKAPAVEASAPMTQPSAAKSFQAAAIWGFAWLAPLALIFAVLGPDHVLSRVGALFAKLAVLTFGGAYALLTYLRQQAVEVEGWLSPEQMIDGLGLAETTPGPLVLVNQFVGFVAGWQADGGGAVLALLAALMATWMTFAPSFLWIFAGAPYAEGLRRNAKASAALAAITAAVLGVVANLAFWFAVHVLFGETNTVALPWGARIDLPNLLSFDFLALAIAAATAVALIRFHVNAIIVVIASAVAGILLTGLS
jgi:chromate transporter